MTDRIALLGMGMLGAGFAEAAIGRGDDVVVWNRTASKCAPLAAKGARVATTVADAARGRERVHLILKDDAVVDAVLAELVPALEAGAVIVDHTTTSPAGTKARAERLAEAGVAFVHAPVFMSPSAAKNGTGNMMLAGPAAVRERVRGPLSKMTGLLDECGDRTDLAAAYKLFGNAMIFAVTAGFADVLAMARALDVPAADAHALFSRFDPSRVLTYRGAMMAKGDFRASFEMTMARKDAQLMLDAAGAEPLTILPAVAAEMDAQIAAGGGQDDLAAIGRPRG